MDARIYQPAKPAPQSGRLKTKFWIVEHEPAARQEPDSLIGWVGSGDTENQVILRFPTREAAVAYCRKNGLTYTVSEPHARVVRPRSYAENFTGRG
jgi:hypothetical protein